MLLLLYAVIASSTVSGFRQAVINPGVNHAVDQIAFGLRSNGTATLAQAPAQDRPSVSFTLLSVESHFRREAPLIIQSNYEKFLVDQAGAKGFVDREMLAATYSTKTIKELQESTKKFMISSGNLGSKHEKRYQR